MQRFADHPGGSFAAVRASGSHRKARRNWRASDVVSKAACVVPLAGKPVRASVVADATVFPPLCSRIASLGMPSPPLRPRGSTSEIVCVAAWQTAAPLAAFASPTLFEQAFGDMFDAGRPTLKVTDESSDFSELREVAVFAPPASGCFGALGEVKPTSESIAAIIRLASIYDDAIEEVLEQGALSDKRDPALVVPVRGPSPSPKPGSRYVVVESSANVVPCRVEEVPDDEYELSEPECDDDHSTDVELCEASSFGRGAGPEDPRVQ